MTLEPSRSLRSERWILLGGALALAVALAIGPVGFGWMLRKAERREAQNELVKIADLQVAQIDEWASERLGDLGVLRRQSLTRGLVDDVAHTPESVELLDLYVLHYGYNEAMIVDEDGRTLARSSSRREPASRQDLQRIVAAAIARGESSARYLGSESEAGRIEFVSPIVGRARMGAVILRMEISDLRPILIAPWGGAEAVSTVLFDVPSQTIIPTDGSPYVRSAGGGTIESIALAGSADSVRGVDRHGREVVAEARSAHVLPWRVLVQTDDEEILSRVEATPVLLGLNGLLLALVVALVSSMLLRERREDAIRRSEERFRTLFEGAPTGILIGRDGLVMDFNPAALRIFGLSNAAEFRGTSVLRWIGGDSRERASAVMPARAAGIPVPQEVDLVGRRLDGTEFPLTVRMATSVLPEGEMGIAFFSDVSDKVRAEKALRTSEEHYRTLIESTSDVIMVVDRQGFVRFAGGAVARATGWLPEEMCGERWVESMEERDRRDLLSWLSRQTNGGPVDLFLYRLKHKDGWWRDFEATANHLPHSSDLFVTSRDVTLRNELEAQLQRANRINSLGRLAGSIAHEFNNILMGILASVELMVREVGPSSSLSTPLGRVKKSVLRGGKITREILHFTRPQEPQPKPFRIAQWLHAAEPELVGLTGEAIELRIHVLDPEIAASADQGHLHQALINLVGNAVTAMPGGGTLTITARRPAPGQHYDFGTVPNAWRFVHIEVRDTGTGIAPDILPHIFEPLFTTHRDGGTGLGLPLVHQFVTLGGGMIYVETEPGTGSAFHLFIPAAESVDHVDLLERRHNILARRVLLVEDDPAVGEGLMALLAESGRNARWITRGDAAEAAVEQFDPDVVVLDLGLPDLDGVAVYGLLASRWPELPVVFSTGLGDLENLEPLLGRPRVGLLLKPYEVDDLLEAVDAVCGGIAAERATA